MKKLSLLLLSFALATCIAQEAPESVAKPKPKATASVDTKSPVTQAEARAIFVKAASILKPVVQGKYSSPSIVAGEKPVTRTQVVAEFSKLYAAAKPSFKLTPKKVRFEKSRLTLKDPVQRQNLERLIASGTVAKLGPIAAGDKETLTVRQFGDAVGFFLARIAEMSHMPSSKWSPSLQP